jgi:putative toxin-antitoxin system antitoxin component (TIGR02293 family)
MTETSVVAIMGGSRVLGKRVRTLIDLAELIQSGMPRSAAQHLRERLNLTESELAEGMGISTKTLQRIAKQPRARLTPAQGDRLYRLARLVALAEGVFEDAERAYQWLREPQRGLGNRVPLALMRTEAGAREVEDLLGRIEYGVFS